MSKVKLNTIPNAEEWGWYKYCIPVIMRRHNCKEGKAVEHYMRLLEFCEESGANPIDVIKNNTRF